MDVNKMKFLSVANKSLVFVLSMSTVFATAAQAVPRPIVPEPALRLHFASHQPKYTVKQLPSGKKMKLHFVGPLIFADGDQALLLSYESDFKLDDMSKLKKEVEEIWTYFKQDASLQGFKHAVITVREEPEGPAAKTARVKNFLFEQKDTKWSCLTDPDVGAPTPEEDECDKAADFAKDGKFEEAIAHYTKAVELNPKSISALLNRSTAYETIGEHKKALADLSALLAISPNYVVAYVNRAWSHGRHKEFAEALEDCNKALAIDPKCAAAFNNRAAVYNDLGQYDKSLDDSTKAIDLAPHLAAAYDTRGVARRHLKQFQQAIDDFNKALSLNPKLGEAYYNRAQAYKAIGDTTHATSDEAKAKELGFKKE
ncbi:MAG TPA: tetratricopeptide repeat protein [Candidatus Melainabacteria bacterium]|nr:tetratricopeptide repeat protein [Candidatus Melainabacteria bacterium]